jgi:hypothetical protein
MKILILIFFQFVAFQAYSQETICHRYNKLNPTQEPANGPRCRVVGDTFYFEGAVTEEMYYELRDYHPEIKRLELNSYGGLALPAYKIAELIRQRGILTNVRNGAKCASACTLIFQAGVERSAHPSVRFLYHAPRLSNLWSENWLETRNTVGRQKSLAELAKQFTETQNETERFFVMLVELGINPNFIERYKALPETSTWFLDGNLMRTENLIISAPRLIEYNVVQSFDFRSEVSEVATN